MAVSAEYDPDSMVQLNIRLKERRIPQIKGLLRITGETQQALFDRLVLEEAQRNPDVLLASIATQREALDQEEREVREDLGL
ncbi:hypothetical protein KDA23_06990 [Candidatus Saccharibacteria bacterium]|nr:hypothetical protein [Candidatus Saccharibacteria bacterium]